PPQAAPGAANGNAPYRGPVALVDVGYIFKTHPEFQQRMENMKKEVEAFENELKSEHQNMQKNAERLATYNPGTPEYKKTEEEVAQARGSLQARAQLKRDEFLKREAQEYLAFYNKVQQAVGGFAYNNRIAIVLRFNRDEMDPNDRGSVLQGVNRPVVSFEPSLDVTDDVLRVMGIAHQNTATRVPPGPPARTRK
ncbi:MAG: OmpH family outer membrane protein, partial [Planctomycetota bacterium]|nr:OmpH family outer membrane protein [Planctomycetota bacterium]